MLANGRSAVALFAGVARLGSTISGWLASGAVLVLTLAVVYDVFMRYLFTSPTTWGLEFSEYLMVAIVYFGLAPALRRDKHVAIDIVTQTFALRSRIRLRLAMTALAVPYVAVLLWQGFELTRRSVVEQRVSQYVSGTPLAIPQAMIVIGCALLLLALVSRMLDDAAALKRFTDAAAQAEGERATP